MPTNRPPIFPGSKQKIQSKEILSYPKSSRRINSARREKLFYNVRTDIGEKWNGAQTYQDFGQLLSSRQISNSSQPIKKKQRPASATASYQKKAQVSNLKRHGSESNLLRRYGSESNLNSQDLCTLSRHNSNSDVGKHGSQSSLLEPNVFGYKSGKQICGSEPDLVKEGLNAIINGANRLSIKGNSSYLDDTDTWTTDPGPVETIFYFDEVKNCAM